ncbi:MAG TPA: sugar phosphate isomerase/epimerase family protein [Phycisphaerae bacterium]|nr:sugar phosphate isomerase/epimerase family protein [Phycisphaerae bacterium]
MHTSQSIALITDECSHDPFTAVELGKRWGIEHYEIRYAYRWRVPNGPPFTADLVAAAVKAYSVTVSAISPGLFKPVMQSDGSQTPINTDTRDEIDRHINELLPRYFDFAHRLGTRNIIVFALPRAKDADDDAPPSIVIDSLARAAQKAGGAGFQLLLENGGGSWADSGHAAKAVLDAVGSTWLRLTWDPANVVQAGLPEDPVAEGYPSIRSYVGNVHVKDAIYAGGKGLWIMLGDGTLDWQRQLAELRRDGYEGMLTIEPHLQYQAPVDLVAQTEMFVSRLRSLLK